MFGIPRMLLYFVLHIVIFFFTCITTLILGKLIKKKKSHIIKSKHTVLKPASGKSCSVRLHFVTDRETKPPGRGCHPAAWIYQAGEGTGSHRPPEAPREGSPEPQKHWVCDRGAGTRTYGPNAVPKGVASRIGAGSSPSSQSILDFVALC